MVEGSDPFSPSSSSSQAECRTRREMPIGSRFDRCRRLILLGAKRTSLLNIGQSLAALPAEVEKPLSHRERHMQERLKSPRSRRPTPGCLIQGGRDVCPLFGVRRPLPTRALLRCHCSQGGSSPIAEVLDFAVTSRATREARDSWFSQAQLAKLIGVNLRTLQDREPQRTRPTGAALGLLKIVATDPRAALKALRP